MGGALELEEPQLAYGCNPPDNGRQEHRRFRGPGHSEEAGGPRARGGRPCRRNGSRLRLGDRLGRKRSCGENSPTTTRGRQQAPSREKQKSPQAASKVPRCPAEAWPVSQELGSHRGRRVPGQARTNTRAKART